MEVNARRYAFKVVRDKVRKNPCYLCEQVDCEGCEHFEKKMTVLTLERRK